MVMTKKMNDNLDKLSSKSSTELIVYQLGEVKNLLQTITLSFDSYKDATDKRLIELEKFQATQLIRSQVEPKIDMQKIILAAFSLISTVIAIALGINFKR